MILSLAWPAGAHIITDLERIDEAIADFEAAMALGGSDFVVRYRDALQSRRQHYGLNPADAPTAEELVGRLSAGRCRLMQ